MEMPVLILGSLHWHLGRWREALLPGVQIETVKGLVGSYLTSQCNLNWISYLGFFMSTLISRDMLENLIDKDTDRLKCLIPFVWQQDCFGCKREKDKN